MYSTCVLYQMNHIPFSIDVDIYIPNQAHLAKLSKDNYWQTQDPIHHIIDNIDAICSLSMHFVIWHVLIRSK